MVCSKQPCALAGALVKEFVVGERSLVEAEELTGANAAAGIKTRLSNCYRGCRCEN